MLRHLLFFHTDDQGYFTGTYNGIVGKIKRISTGEILYEISGKWSDELYITKKVCLTGAGTEGEARGQVLLRQLCVTLDKSVVTIDLLRFLCRFLGFPCDQGNKETYFDAKTATIHPKIVAHEGDQEETESRRLWSGLTAALKTNNQSLATVEKSKVEDAQRAKSKLRQERGEVHVPRYFEPNGDGFDIKLKKYVQKVLHGGRVSGTSIHSFIHSQSLCIDILPNMVTHPSLPFA